MGNGFDNLGTIENSGTLIYGSYSYNSSVFLNGAIVNSGIIIGGWEAGSFSITGNLSGAGDFQEHVTFAGDVQIGDTTNRVAGISANDGYLTFASDARLFMDIASINSFDRVWANEIVLDGQLTITLLDLYMPDVGDILKLFRAESFSGDFSSINFLGLGNLGFETEWVFEENQQAWSYQLSIVEPVPEPPTVVLFLISLLALRAGVRKL